MLTVIIFTYNHRETISKCIESILNQKTTYPYEIHIWDDCSIDGTSDFCRMFSEKFPNKIKLTVQKKNTFCGPYLEMQSLAAIKAVKSPYFSIIDGDDYWCDENKVQLALDFLQSHPEYIGFAHDTCQIDANTGIGKSYIHECLNIREIENPVTFSSKAPFFLTSSRIFRTSDYAAKNILPIDYLLYYYQLSKGPIYFYDKIMAAYLIGNNSTFASQSTKLIQYLNSMFAYKLNILFQGQQDLFCTEMMLKYGKACGVGKKYYIRLKILKAIFGNKLGWKLFMYLNFVPKFGTECLDINYIYANRQTAKDIADKRAIQNDKIENNTNEFSDALSKLNHLLEQHEIKFDDHQIFQAYSNLIMKSTCESDYQAIHAIETQNPIFMEYLYKSYQNWVRTYPDLERRATRYNKLSKRIKRLKNVLIILFVLLIIYFVVSGVFL